MATIIPRYNHFGLLVLLICSVGLATGSTTFENNSAALGSHDFCATGMVEFSPECPTLEMSQTSHGNIPQNDAFGAPLINGQIGSLEPDPPSTNYDVRDSPGKGLGLFATKVIPRGTPILIEEPLVSVPAPEIVPGYGFKITDMIADIEASFQVLTLHQQQEFLQLHDFRFPSEEKQNHLLTIFRSNAYNTGEDRIGLFPKIARINHSCRPNSGNWWSEKTGRRVIFASRDINVGEEITVSYIPLLHATSSRQARLQQYGFTCSCSACQSIESDKRRVKVSDLLDSLEQKLHSASKKDELNKKRVLNALALIDMIEAEGLTDYLARAYHIAAVFNKHRSNLRDAETWAVKELEVLRWAELDSKEVFAVIDFIDNLNSRT